MFGGIKITMELKRNALRVIVYASDPVRLRCVHLRNNVKYCKNNSVFHTFFYTQSHNY